MSANNTKKRVSLKQSDSEDEVQFVPSTDVQKVKRSSSRKKPTFHPNPYVDDEAIYSNRQDSDSDPFESEEEETKPKIRASSHHSFREPPPPRPKSKPLVFKPPRHAAAAAAAATPSQPTVSPIPLERVKPYKPRWFGTNTQETQATQVLDSPLPKPIPQIPLVNDPPSLQGKRTRSWCYTVFPKPEQQMHELKNAYMNHLQQVGVTYAIFGLETCPDTGRPHFQGFVYFQNPRQFRSTKQNLTWEFQPAHVEPAMDIKASIDYCKKEGDFIEYGTPPMTQQQKGDLVKERWKTALDSAKANKVDDIEPQLQITHYRSLCAIAQRHSRNLKLEPTKFKHYWLVGATGGGKSHSARAMFGNESEFYYLKDTQTKWWDAYEGEQAAILDEIPVPETKMRNSMGNYLKSWTDENEFAAESKGGSMKIRPRVIIMTSNHYLEDWGLPDIDLAALHRRITQVYLTQRNDDGTRVPSQPREGTKCITLDQWEFWNQETQQIKLHPVYTKWKQEQDQLKLEQAAANLANIGTQPLPSDEEEES